MKKILILMLVLFCFGLAGCYQFVAEHPEKSQEEFYEDQADCEKKARAYTQERLQEMSDVDEINYARRCMRNLGWEYHFRNTSSDDGSGSDAKKAE